MTQEQKRIKLAEAAGWKRIPAETVGAAAKLFYGDIWWRDAENNTIACADQLPDYFNDLNAVHELEKVLTDEQWPEYREELRTIVIGGIRLVSQWCKTDLHATAAQRAEAFGLTLGLWEASK
jgi:hypothetical protein